MHSEQPLAALQPEAGDTYVHCGHVRPGVTYHLSRLDALFARPDGSACEAKWLACCDRCHHKARGDASKVLVLGDARWAADELPLLAGPAPEEPDSTGPRDSTSPATKEGEERRPLTTPARLRKRLGGQLLSLGGSEVKWEPSNPHAALVAARGQECPQQVRMRRGAPRRCHANAVELWARAADRYQLVTGYALYGDEWLSHSWVVDGKTLYETTHRFDRYFGAVLRLAAALEFWMEYVSQTFPDAQAPPGFWEEHRSVLDLLTDIVKSHGHGNRQRPPG
jgi:hypothetical protein